MIRIFVKNVEQHSIYCSLLFNMAYYIDEYYLDDEYYNDSIYKIYKRLILK